VALAAALTLAAIAVAVLDLPRAPLLVLDLCLLVLCATDFLRIPAPDDWSVERTLPERAGLSQPFQRTIHIRGTGALAVEVHEEFPRGFEVVAVTGPAGNESSGGDPSGGPDRGRGAMEGADDDSLELERTYRAHRRGAHLFGHLRVLVRGPFGLVERRSRRGVMAASQVIEIEPALLNLGQTLRLAASDRWQDLGARRLRRTGGQTEFESLREYAVGDDVRRVDWKAYARRGKPMVRQDQEERGQELIILFDCGRRMRATAQAGEAAGWTKLDWALDAGLQLAAVALQRGDRVGALAFDDGVRVLLAPARGRRQLVRMTRLLFPLQPAEREGNLVRALRELSVRHPRRASILILSDVADPMSIEEQRRALASASSRHRLIFAALDDPGLRSAAAGVALAGDAPPALLRAAALETVADRKRSLRRLRSSGARILDALPAEAAGPLLAAWLDERRAV